MQVFLCVCFIILSFIYSADGQGVNETCRGRKDFDLCLVDWTCDLEVSQCFCRSETPYCRCNNYINEFYLGNNCSQKWSTLSFALVATLPGVALALVVGAAVHLVHRSRKSSKSHRARNELTVIPEQDISGVIFASDLNAPPHPGPMPVQVVPMVSSQLYSFPDNAQSGALTIGTSPPHYSAPDTHPAIDRPPLGPSYSLPFSPVMSGAAQQPYSYIQGGAQVLSNPYAKVNNPYEERSMSPEPRHQTPSPQPYDDQRMALPPAISYVTSEMRRVLPRAQLGRQF